MPYCHPCQRSFMTYNGYQNHIDNSYAHREDDEPDEFPYECEICTYSFRTDHAREQHHSSSHSYCEPCQRVFQNANNLRMHQHGRDHMGNSIQCPFCHASFTTASGVTIHLESGTCTQSNLNRASLNDIVQLLDRNNIITRPMLTLPGYSSNSETVATAKAWNGSGYQCYLCGKEFGTLHGLNMHIRSPAHEQSLYKCPKGSCGKNFRALSGLVQHVESETCGVMRFMQVQEQARGGIQNMVGRMITG